MAKKHKFNYEVCYVKKPYGKKSKMRKRECEPATSLKDAKKWKKAIQKEKDVSDVKINKLSKLAETWLMDDLEESVSSYKQRKGF